MLARWSLLSLLAAAALSSSCVPCTPVQCADVACACLPQGPLVGAGGVVPLRPGSVIAPVEAPPPTTGEGAQSY